MAAGVCSIGSDCVCTNEVGNLVRHDDGIVVGRDPGSCAEANGLRDAGSEAVRLAIAFRTERCLIAVFLQRR